MAFTLYGWWHWWRGVQTDGEVRVVPLNLRGWLVGLAAGAVGSVFLGWLMVRIGAALPHLDAALTSYSLVASWWGARKHIANWWLWIAVDLVYIGEYLYKDLRLTALLYAGLVVLAVTRSARMAARTSRSLNRRLHHVVQAARPSSSAAVHSPRYAERVAQTARSIRRCEA